MQNWYKNEGIDELKLREYMRPEGRGNGDGRGMGMMDR